MTITERQQELLALPRWAQVTRVIGWHRHPLEAADGCTSEEIAAIESRVGMPLPTAVREWFELLGHRLREVQDRPATAHDVAADRDRICVWAENQWAWQLFAPPGEDPVGELDGTPLDVPISALLTGMLISETLVGSWAGQREGPLGELAPSVIGGGLLEDIDDNELDALRTHYPRLPWPLPMDWATWHGDDDTIIRFMDGGFLEWMTTTSQALDNLSQHLRLDTGWVRLVIHISPLTDQERAELWGNGGLSVAKLLGQAESAITQRCHLVSTALLQTPSQAEFVADTDDPDGLVALLIEALESWGDRLRITSQPERGGPMIEVYPPAPEPRD